MADVTNIPAPRVPFIDERTGLMSREWYRFFLNLFNLTGAGSNQISLSDLQVAPQAEVNDLSSLYSQAQIVSMMQSYEVALNAVSQKNDVEPSDENAAKIDKLTNDIQALNVAPQATYPHFRHAPYGEFYDTTTQTAAAINTAYPITYNTTVYSDGIKIGTPASRIYVLHDGIFNFQFSAELAKAAAALGQVWIWSRINGADQADSSGRIGLSGSSADVIATWNYIYDMKAGDYFELVWATNDTNCQIKAEAATAFAPAVPSILLTVTDNIRALQY